MYFQGAGVTTQRICCQQGCLVQFLLYINSLSPNAVFFKASALWADAFYKSKCPPVCLSVRVCVRSLLRYRLNVFWPPLPEVGCQIFLEIRNPWGKVMERSGLRQEHFGLKIVFNRRTKIGFLLLLILPYTKGGNHAQRPLVEGRIANFCISFCVLHDFFRFSKKSGFWVFLVHPETMLPDGLETSGQRAYR